jgi:hypothetical protein
MQTLPRSGRVRGVAQELEDHDAVLGALEPGDGLVGDRGDLGLALVVRDREAGVLLDAGQALLGLVEGLPGRLDRDVEGLVGDDVAPAEEVVVLAAGALELALQDAQGVRVVVDALDDRGLVLDASSSRA